MPGADQRAEPGATDIRAMHWTDLAAAHAIEQQAFGSGAWSLESFWSELAGVPDTRTYLVALDSAGSVAGYAGLAFAGSDADVQTIAVAATARRAGTGARLLAALVTEAARREAAWIHLEVSARNAAAIALYERFGFEPVRRRPDYYGPGNDAVIMRRRAR